MSAVNMRKPERAHGGEGRCDCRIPLCEAKAGGKVKVACVEGGRGLCGRMAAMGIYPGAEVQLLCSGCGCPCLIRVKGGVISLGDGVSEKILVTSSA